MKRNTGFMIAVVVIAMVMSVSHVQAGWMDGGTPVCTAPGSQWYPRIISDDACGGIIAWQDDREGNGDVYIQRIDANGNVLWTTDGAAVCSEVSDQSYFRQVVSDGAGGAIVSWIDHRNGGNDIYAQRVDSDGDILWTVNGIAVCTSTGDNLYPVVIPDGTGGSIIAWQRDQGPDGKVYVQKIGAGGAVQWNTAGVAVCGSVGQNHPRLARDGTGGAVVVWNDGSIPGADIRAQKIDGGGNLLWGGDGITVCTGCDIRNFAQLSPCGGGCVIIAWHDLRSGGLDIYAQKIDASGNVLWVAGGVGVCTASQDQWFPRIIQDGSGGGIIAWVDLRGGEHDIYAQRIDDSGNAVWTANGIAVCTAELYQINPRIVSDGVGGAIVSWQDDRSGIYGIFCQRIDSSGSIMWAPDGIAMSGSQGGERLPEIASDGSGGAIVTWEDWTGGQPDLRCQRITASGEFVATLLASYSARYDESAITLTWSLSRAGGAMNFMVLRASSTQRPFAEVSGEGIRTEHPDYYFTDMDIESGESYVYRVDVVDEDGRRVLFETDPIDTPAQGLALHQNFPNPFNPLTTIGYYLPERTEVTLDIYDASGRCVTRLVDREQGKGMHESEWDGVDSCGEPAGSGVYFYRLRAGRRMISRKMVIIR